MPPPLPPPPLLSPEFTVHRLRAGSQTCECSRPLPTYVDVQQIGQCHWKIEFTCGCGIEYTLVGDDAFEKITGILQFKWTDNRIL